MEDSFKRKLWEIGKLDLKQNVFLKVKRQKNLSDFIKYYNCKSTLFLLQVLLANVPPKKKEMLGKFISNLYKLFVDLYFTYLEINPLVVTDSKIYILDLAAKLDSTADFICKPQWGEIDYPPPFGRDALPGLLNSFEIY